MRLLAIILSICMFQALKHADAQAESGGALPPGFEAPEIAPTPDLSEGFSDGVLGTGNISYAARIRFDGTIIGEATYRKPLLTLDPLAAYNVTAVRLEGNVTNIEAAGIGAMAGYGLDYFTEDFLFSVEARFWVTYGADSGLNLTPEILGVFSIPYNLY